MPKFLSLILLLYATGAYAAPSYSERGVGRHANFYRGTVAPAPTVAVSAAPVASNEQTGAAPVSAQNVASDKMTENIQLSVNVQNTAVVKDAAHTATGVAPAGAVVSVEKNDALTLQRNACLARGMAGGDTFVWASRNSNSGNYYSMVEDVNNPENNACFVKIDIRNTDERIKTHDIPGRYFMVGQNITCGSWALYDDLKSRILQATKKGRTWGTVASTVLSAGVGVGAMELFGNRLIGGKVMGQKALDEKELLISQIKELQRENVSEYNRVISAMETLDATCAKEWVCEKPDACDGTKNPFLGLRSQLDK